MAATRQDLMTLLDRLGLAVVTHEHAAVFTVAQSEGIKTAMPGGHTKNLFLKDKKGALILIAALAETTIELKDLHRRLGCGRLSFGKPELLEEVLGVTPGSVTGFALINDQPVHDPEAKDTSDGKGPPTGVPTGATSSPRVRFLIDAALMAHDPINFHPLENTATTAISPEDFLAFARACGHEPEIIEFG